MVTLGLGEKVSYSAAGSFVRFIKEKYGTTKLKAVWQGGVASIPHVLGEDGSDPELTWHEHLKRLGASAPVEK